MSKQLLATGFHKLSERERRVITGVAKRTRISRAHSSKNYGPGPSTARRDPVLRIGSFRIYRGRADADINGLTLSIPPNTGSGTPRAEPVPPAPPGRFFISPAPKPDLLGSTTLPERERGRDTSCANLPRFKIGRFVSMTGSQNWMAHGLA
jgi:hypothetical protein